MNEPENRRKRYCLICHLFKPEKCHHCSTCKSCMLGMDHHCPWLATCIGFFNRKHFMLTLIYSLTSILIIVGFNAHKIVFIVRALIKKTVSSEGYSAHRRVCALCFNSAHICHSVHFIFHGSQLLPFSFRTSFKKQHNS